MAILNCSSSRSPCFLDPKTVRKTQDHAGGPSKHIAKNLVSGGRGVWKSCSFQAFPASWWERQTCFLRRSGERSRSPKQPQTSATRSPRARHASLGRQGVGHPDLGSEVQSDRLAHCCRTHRHQTKRRRTNSAGRPNVWEYTIVKKDQVRFHGQIPIT